jgi:hypothetical protein
LPSRYRSPSRSISDDCIDAGLDILVELRFHSDRAGGDPLFAILNFPFKKEPAAALAAAAS